MSGMDCIITCGCTYLSFDYGFYLAMLWSDIRKGYTLFLNSIAPQILDVNPLPILMRAVNSVACKFPIRQPCWRSERWKSKT